MKKIIALTACSCMFGASFAQKTVKNKNNPAVEQRKLAASGKCAIDGTIKDARNHPISDVEVFIYGADSSILASGYTDVTGAFETNSVLKGKYNVKVVYPNDKETFITGVAMKPGFTPINLNTEPPVADISMPYSDIAPKPAEKNKHIKKTTVVTTTTTTKVTTTTTATVPKKKK